MNEMYKDNKSDQLFAVAVMTLAAACGSALARNFISKDGLGGFLAQMGGALLGVDIARGFFSDGEKDEEMHSEQKK